MKAKEFLFFILKRNTVNPDFFGILSDSMGKIRLACQQVV
jgi:hypothetical protein